MLLSQKLLNDKNLLQEAKISVEKILGDELTFGVEIEFYLLGAKIEDLLLKIPEYNFHMERGENQIEYHIGPFSNPNEFSKTINQSIKKIIKTCEDIGGVPIFEPKPFKNDFGNALQIQISSKSQIFQTKLEEIAASFCYYAEQTFLAYVPCTEDYMRYNSDFMTPTHIAFGGNNRSCLFRINGDAQKRLEIRSPSIYCNIDVALFTIYKNIQKALCEETRIHLYPKIYGNAFDPQYKLATIPKSINDASEVFDEKFYF